jgi:hypothetical protein
MMRRLTIEDMQAIATARGGRCLSTRYVNNRTPLEWECAQGHRWWATPGNVKSNSSWCDVCAKKKPKRPRFTMDDLQALAGAHGGRCLSTQCPGMYAPLEWECAEGHRWFTPARNIRRGRWCPACAYQRKRLPLAEIQRVAGERGGRCLSTGYVNFDTPLEFECAAGHRWHTPYSQIHKGAWCPQCYLERRTGMIGEMRALAASHGGECLSATYENQNQLLRWRCANGHEWMSPARVAKRHWCQRCHHERQRLGIEMMHEIAASRGGRCLSDAYVSTRQPLQWECRLGHVWSTKPAVVVRGHWCPQCAYLERSKKRSNRLKYDFAG